MLRHPYIGRTTKVQGVPLTDSKANLSINWSEGDDKLEVLDGSQGKSIPKWVLICINLLSK